MQREGAKALADIFAKDPVGLPGDIRVGLAILALLRVLTSSDVELQV